MEWTLRPVGIAMFQSGVEVQTPEGGAPTDEAVFIGADLAKRSSWVHEVRKDGSVAFRRTLKRRKLLGFLASQPRCMVAMEARASGPPSLVRSRRQSTAVVSGWIRVAEDATAASRRPLDHSCTAPLRFNLQPSTCVPMSRVAR